MAELRDVLHELESRQGQELDPPWPHFQELVAEALTLAAAVAEATGREREALAAHVHEQERYAQQAHDERNQALYRTRGRTCKSTSSTWAKLLPSAARRGAASAGAAGGRGGAAAAGALPQLPGRGVEARAGQGQAETGRAAQGGGGGPRDSTRA